MFSFPLLVVCAVVVYFVYRVFNLVSYLVFKIHILQKVLLWKLHGDEKIWDEAIDYVLENDYEYKNTIRMLGDFSKPSHFETVDGLGLNIRSALDRYKDKHKK
jgi:hypothetical protein